MNSLVKVNVLSVTRAVVVAAVLMLSTPHPCPGQTAAEYHDRADRALQSYLIKFWNGGQQYLRNLYPSDGSLTGYWTYAQGWDALLDGVERTYGTQYSGLIESFYQGQNRRGWFSGYYDDECWMTLALTRAYDLTGDPKYLAQAQTIYADIMTGWDTSCCGTIKGGMWWDKAHTQKATAANAGTALAGARLYQRTGNATYLSFAEQVYSFWFANMVNPSTFQVCDHINPDGSKTWWRFTYNEGLMIGASLELYLATGTASYLLNAHRIAGYMVNVETAASPYGRVLSDGSNTSCGGDCHQFKGPAIRYLSRLYAQDTTKTQYYTVLRASAEAIWNLARETDLTIFSVSWTGPAQSTVDQGQDNAACMGLSRFAQLYGPYPGSGIPLNQYEAENAVIRNISLEASYGGFTGWGYLAAWNGNGQVDFKINSAVAGPHELVFRYAAGAGNASRAITANGVTLASSLSFPNTGGWPNYQTVNLPCNLPAGPSTVSVIFDSAQGSSNWLNLDNLIVNGDPPEQVVISGFSVNSTGTVHLTWNARIGQFYHLQTSASPAGPWDDVEPPIFASETSASADDVVGTNQARYYRVLRP